nr:AIF_HP1_G0030540.mRNA.1.CDS.1 [Saccharomyces cerevisiae]
MQTQSVPLAEFNELSGRNYPSIIKRNVGPGFNNWVFGFIGRIENPFQTCRAIHCDWAYSNLWDLPFLDGLTHLSILHSRFHIQAIQDLTSRNFPSK